jgi:Zn-dependent M16 (insulinase) family peptidase
MDPSNRGYAAMIREFSNLTDERRRQFRGEILDMKPEKLLEDCRHYFPAVLNSAVIAVYSSEDSLRRAGESMEIKLKMEALV